MIKIKTITDKIKVLDVGDYSIAVDANLTYYTIYNNCALVKKNKHESYIVKEILPSPSVSIIYFNVKVKNQFMKGKKYSIVGYMAKFTNIEESI